MPKRTDIKSILIVGSGPIVIGQACSLIIQGLKPQSPKREWLQSNFSKFQSSNNNDRPRDCRCYLH